MSEDKRKSGQPAPSRGGPQAPDGPERTSASRRRFTKTGIATPILMTLASRPVLGEGRLCTPSAFASMTPSRPVDTSTCVGCSPGYWHHPNACWYQTGLNRTDTFAATFGYTPSAAAFTNKEREVLNLQLQQFFPSPNTWDLTFKGDQYALYKMCRAATALTLSILHPAVPLTITVYEVMNRLYDALGPTGQNRNTALYEPTKMFFESFYDNTDANCPLPNDGNCPEINP